MSLVSIVSVFHNRARTVERTLASLLAQDYPALEIVLVDDGSSDGTLEKLRCYESKDVRVLRHANKGFTAALKDAVAPTRGEFIAIQGSGDESMPSRISRQVELLRRYPEAVAAGCAITNVDELSGARWDVKPSVEYRPGPIEARFGISHGELMLRRTAYERTGGYRTFFKFGQVSDLLRRMTLLGGIAYANEVLYRRYLTSDGVSAKPEKIALRNLYAALSMQALRRRKAGPLAPDEMLPPDEIDLYEGLAPLFMLGDGHVARTAAALSTQLLSLDRREAARQFAAMSLRQKLTLHGAAAWALAWLGPRAAPQRLLRRHSEKLSESARARPGRNSAASGVTAPQQLRAP